MIFVSQIVTYPIQMISKSARKYGRRWSMLYTDGFTRELHAFARRMNIGRAFYQPEARNYLITPKMREKVIQYGAKEECRVMESGSSNSIVPRFPLGNSRIVVSRYQRRARSKGFPL